MSTTWQTTTFRAEQLPNGDPSKLRELAVWYRQLAERTGNPTIWEARLLTAKDLDAKADHMERLLGARASSDDLAHRELPRSLTILYRHPDRPHAGGISMIAEQVKAAAMVTQLEDRGFVVDKITARSRPNTIGARSAMPVSLVEP
jgi:hypothetical protein